MSTNKALWNRVFITDPKAVKAITGKDYGGNSPKPYWIVERLTDEFGPCGIGWGYTIDDERFERFSDTDTLHIARVTLWYEMDGKRGTVTQMGQTKATYMTSGNKFKVDEDAPKKSVTDALVKCASYLGFAGDIFSGRWDDSKYVAEAAKHWAGDEEVTADQLSMFEPKVQTQITKSAQAAIQAFREGNEWGAYEELTSCVDKLSKGDSHAANQVKLALASIYQTTPKMKAAIRALAEREHSKATA